MAKRTQPKLSRPRAEVNMTAYRYAIQVAADSLLLDLYLAALYARRGNAEDAERVQHDAVIAAEEMHDFLRLVDGCLAPRWYIGQAADRHPEHADFAEPALQLLASVGGAA